MRMSVYTCGKRERRIILDDGIMQSSLLKFVQRQEKPDSSRKRRQGDGDEPGVETKRQKTATRSKLKQFNRQLTQNRESSDTKNSRSLSMCMNDPKPLLSEKCSQTLPIEDRSPTPTPNTSQTKPPIRSKSRGKKPEPSPHTSSHSDTVSKQYTPLEQQYIAIKAQYPDTILFVECGYKYRFFGEDAEVASKALNIGCFEDHNFFTASIPVHRLHVHLRRLVAAGHKVGVVRQTETAALKSASDKKSGPFSRELTALYTRTTLLGPDVQPPTLSNRWKRYGGGGGGGRGEGEREDGRRWVDKEMEEEEEGLWMMCVCEQMPTTTKEKTSDITIGFMAVQPAVGHMMYDQFTDNVNSMSELQLRLSHLQPAEILFPHSSSAILVDALLNWKKVQVGVRIEKLSDEWFEPSSAISTVTEFYSSQAATSVEQSDLENSTDGVTEDGSGGNKALVPKGLGKVSGLPQCSLSCLSALIHHLKFFKLQQILKLTSNLQLFSMTEQCMKLNSKTLENLEIFQNQVDNRERNTLFWILDHTKTQFGRRLLRKWTACPLRRVSDIEKRQIAVRQLSKSESLSIPLLRKLVTRLPDLEKMLCSAYHKKCSPMDFCVLMQHLTDIRSQVESISPTALADLDSELLQLIIKQIPKLLQECSHFQSSLNEKSAREGRYEELFTDLECYPDVLKQKKCIAEVEQRLNSHKQRFRRTLANPKADYTTVSGVQYLVEVKNKNIDKVPSDWTRISGTKQVTRFHPPYVLEDVQLLAQHSDQLVLCAKQAWSEFLSDFGAHYGICKKAIDMLATLDCLLSLATVAIMPGYVCPRMVEETVVEIEGGRHPVIDLLLTKGEQYVANDTKLSNTEMHGMIITGPNMGGKSSYIKQVALICIMAQIGSFVPAKSARLGVLDAVYTRMGASDRIFAGKSTFMVELVEASEIMSQATPQSLVILDELGRGTSTHDGMAVAYATLTHFICEIKSLTLFVTHYPLLATLESVYPDNVGNFHMSYVEAETTGEGYEKIVFLYQLERGQAGKSYGLNVAALAGLDRAILKLAAEKSRELEVQCRRRSSRLPSHHLECMAAGKTIVSIVNQQEQFDPETVIQIAKRVFLPS